MSYSFSYYTILSKTLHKQPEKGITIHYWFLTILLAKLYCDEEVHKVNNCIVMNFCKKQQAAKKTIHKKEKLDNKKNAYAWVFTLGCRRLYSSIIMPSNSATSCTLHTKIIFKTKNYHHRKHKNLVPRILRNLKSCPIFHKDIQSPVALPK